jgi:hypothetical protein
MNNKPRNEEPLTKEMEAQIKEIFWEDPEIIC